MTRVVVLAGSIRLSTIIGLYLRKYKRVLMDVLEGRYIYNGRRSFVY